MHLGVDGSIPNGGSTSSDDSTSQGESSTGEGASSDEADVTRELYMIARYVGGHSAGSSTPPPITSITTEMLISIIAWFLPQTPPTFGWPSTRR